MCRSADLHGTIWEGWQGGGFAVRIARAARKLRPGQRRIATEFQRMKGQGTTCGSTGDKTPLGCHLLYSHDSNFSSSNWRMP